ncbi:MAG: RNA 2',3'-cyclic phosphodiesterase [bacterium]|nr:RNA 2',3'-cyclic phosphodiesterase [bacterium]
MRLFLAIDLPKEIKDYLFELEKKVKEAKITWVSKKNLHLTLKFLGEVNEKDLPKIKKQIQITHSKLKVKLGATGFFPNNKDPRVIWVSLEPEEQIIALQQKLDAQLLMQFPNEQKFQAHLTLGRIKSIRRKEDFFNSIKSIQLEQKKFEINSFQLMKSELTKLGPIYETLETILLSEM